MTANPPAQPPDTGAGPDSITNAMTALFESTTAQRGGADLEPGSVATPFSTFFWAALRYLNDGVQADRDTAEAQFADDIQWAMMNNGQVRKGKRDVLAWCWSGGFASHEEPVIIHNSANREWGVWEYWNIGELTADVVAFAEASKWPFPPNVDRLVGRTYMIPDCFVYHINVENKIDSVRGYLQVQSLMTQFR